MYKTMYVPHKNSNDMIMYSKHKLTLTCIVTTIFHSYENGEEQIK